MSSRARRQKVYDAEGRLLRKDGGLDRRAPPKETQFKRGQSGNTKGRPKKKSISLEEEFLRAMNAVVTVPLPDGRRVKMSKMEVALTQLFNLAASGKLPAIKMIAEMRRQYDSNYARPVTIVFDKSEENL